MDGRLLRDPLNGFTSCNSVLRYPRADQHANHRKTDFFSDEITKTKKQGGQCPGRRPVCSVYGLHFQTITANIGSRGWQRGGYLRNEGAPDRLQRMGHGVRDFTNEASNGFHAMKKAGLTKPGALAQNENSWPVEMFGPPGQPNKSAWILKKTNYNEGLHRVVRDASGD